MTISGTKRPSTKIRDPRIGQGNYERADEDHSIASLLRQVVGCVLKVELACNRLLESRLGSHGTTKTAMLRILRAKIKDVDRARKVMIAVGKKIDPGFRP